MTVSSDGSQVFLITPSGVRRFDLPAARGFASQLQISNVSTFRAAGTPTTFTVTALDPAGNVATNFADTVSFGSTDPAAGLPAPYTFTPADAGVHTFTVTWNTAGSRTLTVRDTSVANSVTATTPAVTVTSGAVSLIPVTNHRDLVYDDAHGLELWATDGTSTTGMVQDIAVGAGWSSPSSFTPVGSLVFFTATDGITGTELWAISRSAIHRAPNLPEPKAGP